MATLCLCREPREDAAEARMRRRLASRSGWHGTSIGRPISSEADDDAMTDEAVKAMVKSANGQNVVLAFSISDAAEADFAGIAEIYAYHVQTGLASFEEEPPGPDEMLRR